MHPYIAQQLARQKEEELRRQAELARLSSANRRTRRNRLRRALRWLRPRFKGLGAAPPIDVRDEPLPPQLAEDAPSVDAAASGSIRRDEALCRFPRVLLRRRRIQMRSRSALGDDPVCRTAHGTTLTKALDTRTPERRHRPPLN